MTLLALSQARATVLAAIDSCVLIESQYSGWSAAMNRFSWFKRTVKELGSKLAQDPDISVIRPNLDQFHEFIANVMFPIGIHMTGPMRSLVKQVDQSTHAHLPAPPPHRAVY